MAVVVECVACKTLHTLADREAAGETWCSGCGSLLHSDRPVPELVHETRHLACDRPLLSPGFGRRAWQKVATRPASVNVAIGAAILMFVVEVAAALRRTGPSLPLQQVLFSHLTVIAVIIFGLILRSRLVWAMARIMGAVGAFLLGQMALWEHSRHWGSAPQSQISHWPGGSWRCAASLPS